MNKPFDRMPLESAIEVASLNLEQVRQRLWQAQDVGYEQLRRLGDQKAEFVYGTETLRYASEADPTMLACMDERVTFGPFGEVNKLALPFTGYTAAERAEMARRIKAERLPLKQITYHEGCAASAAAAHRGGENKTAEATGLTSTEEVRRLIDLHEQPKFVSFKEMRGDKRFHDARAITIDLTARSRFNPQLIPDFPASFKISAAFSPRLRQDTEIALNIALGSHGFGNRFGPGSELAVVYAYDEQSQSALAQARTELSDFVRNEKYQPQIIELELVLPTIK